MTESLERLLASGIVRYSQVWEDHALLEDGLEIPPGDDVLSIASAGCNVLALLLREPLSVAAVDLNPAQLALVELKLRAIEELTWEQFVRLSASRRENDRLPPLRARTPAPVSARLRSLGRRPRRDRSGHPLERAAGGLLPRIRGGGAAARSPPRSRRPRAGRGRHRRADAVLRQVFGVALHSAFKSTSPASALPAKGATRDRCGTWRPSTSPTTSGSASAGRSRPSRPGGTTTCIHS